MKTSFALACCVPIAVLNTGQFETLNSEIQIKFQLSVVWLKIKGSKYFIAGTMCTSVWHLAQQDADSDWGLEV